MTGVELAKGVYWVGAIDWNLRDFHGYTTRRGTTYNAYLVVDEKIALIDTVKSQFFSEMLGRIKEIIEPSRINYIIVNHVEMDHSSSLPMMLGEAKNAEVVATQNGKIGLDKHYDMAGVKLRVVKEGDALNLGKNTLKFIPIPMLHWPDSMATYIPEDRVLLPNDAFGQHLASSKRFSDELDPCVVMDEAAKYYANILMPFGTLIGRALESLGKLKIDVVAPSHGVIWRKESEIKAILSKYAAWGSGAAKNKVIIAYDTMWGSTERMAHAIAQGITDEGIEAVIYRIAKTDQSDIVKEMLDAKGVIVGSPTLNNGMFPETAAFLTYIKGLRPKGKAGAAFGSYGWGGSAVVKTIEENLKEAGMNVVESDLAFKFVPKDAELKKCLEFGMAFASKLK